MTPAETYRARAKEYDEKAKRVVDYEAKRIYGDLADQWRHMAEQAERFRPPQSGQGGTGKRKAPP